MKISLKSDMRFPGFKILDRYILRRFLQTYAFAIAMITVVLVVFDYAERVDDFTELKAPFSAIIFDYYLNFVPDFINQYSGLFTFIAVIFFTSKMAYQTEIIAMLSGGMSFMRLMWPYFLGALVITLLSLALNLWVIPVSQISCVEFEQKYADGKIVHNTLQTNGTLITQEWASFFRQHDFLIGISIDGPQDIHDRYRKDKGGAPTFDKVMRGLSILYRTGVEYNTMSTINKASEGRGLEVYQFLKSLGTRYMQFMPVVEHVKYPLTAAGKPDKGARPHIVNPSEAGAVISPWSVGSLAFGRFMCDIFDYWVRNDVGRWFVNLFDATLAGWCGERPGTCAYAETCGDNTVVEHNGDLYPCDHFVYPEYLLGNIYEKDLREMMTSDRQVRFGIEKRNSLPYRCVRCKYYFACHGECPKHRFNRTESGETGLNALCDGYFMFYSHVSPYMDKMKELLMAGQAPAGVIPWARMRAMKHI